MSYYRLDDAPPPEETTPLLASRRRKMTPTRTVIAIIGAVLLVLLVVGIVIIALIYPRAPTVQRQGESGYSMFVGSAFFVGNFTENLLVNNTNFMDITIMDVNLTAYYRSIVIGNGLMGANYDFPARSKNQLVSVPVSLYYASNLTLLAHMGADCLQNNNLAVLLNGTMYAGTVVGSYVVPLQYSIALPCATS